MKKVYYRKLIRDKIPDKIKARGSKLETKKLNQKQFELELRLKLVEEAGGVIVVKSKTELLSELADIQVVIDELKRTNKIKPAEMNKALKENIAKKGGFKKQLYLVWSADDGYKTNEKKGENNQSYYLYRS